MKHAFTALFVFCSLTVSHAQRAEGPDGKVYTYKEVDGVERQIEIYFPEGHDAKAKPVPGIIFFHGGGWGGGTRDQFKYPCDYFASRGLVAATVTYRLANKEARDDVEEGTSRKRLCMPDAKSAIRWFKENAGELGVDPERIIAGGGSAGGHISLISTTNPGLNDPADSKEFDASVVAYVLYNPALSLSDASDPEIDFLQQMKNPMPPAIAFFGSEDKGWLEGWDPAMEQWRAQEGAELEYRVAEGEKHAFFNSQPWADLCLIAADQFLSRQGLLKGKPTLKAPASGEKLLKQ